MKIPKVGMKVKYSHAWLKSVQADAEISELKGEIKEVRKISNTGKFYCRVLWSTGEYYGILNSNLVEIKDKSLIDPTE